MGEIVFVQGDKMRENEHILPQDPAESKFAAFNEECGHEQWVLF